MSKVVVYVEDNEGDVFLMRRGMRMLSEVELCVFETGGEALDAIEALDVSLIVTDWYLPDMTGGDLVEALASRGFAMGVPLVIMSGSGEVSLEAEGVSLAMKPNSLSELRELIGAWASRYELS